MKKHLGAALLIVLSMVSLVSIFILHIWFLTSFSYDITANRMQWYKNFYTTDAVLTVGLGIVQNNFQLFMRQVYVQSDPYVLDLSLLVACEKGHEGFLHAMLTAQGLHDKKHADSVLLTAMLIDGKHCVSNMRCILKRIVVRTDKKDEVLFVVSHFSLGPDS